MTPSLLFVDQPGERPRIPEELFSGIHLDELFAGHLPEFLRIPCKGEEYELRHYLFWRMEESAFFEALSAFCDSLTAFLQAQRHCEQAQNECETLLGFVSLARCFYASGKLAEKIEISDGRLPSFTEYRRAISPLLAELSPCLNALEPTLERICSGTIIFRTDHTFLGKLPPSPGYFERICSSADSLGFSLPSLPEQRTLVLPHELSAAFMKLFPDEFRLLREFFTKFSGRIDTGMLGLREELYFCFSIHSLAKRAREKGVSACLPQVLPNGGFRARNAYDITLLEKTDHIVPNDIDFTPEHPFYFLTGANGGGKTTYLRAVATNLIFAACGCPVFAESAAVGTFRVLGAHFPAPETTESGRLYEEELRVKAMLDSTEETSFLFFNETFSGANDIKGLALTLDCAQVCVSRGIYGLFVTHFHEVCGHSFPVLSTVIDERDTAHRTYKIAPNTGMKSSYAEDVLRKYRLSGDTIRSREVK